MQTQFFIIFFIFGICFAEIEVPNHPTNLDEVPLVKERCEKKGKSDTYDRLKTAMQETRTCLQEKIDPNQVKNELEEAKKTGSMDEVFGKYCNKRQEYKECILKTVNVTKECLDETEINALETAIRVIEEVADFACYRDGDRLAMFVAEGGNECVTNRSEQVKTCLNATLKLDTSNWSFSNLPAALPNLRIDKQKCDDLGQIQQCVVNDLENNCKDTTPANIIDALFKFIKKSVCKNLKQKRSANAWKLPIEVNINTLSMLNSSNVYDKVAQECRKNGGEEAFVKFWESIAHARNCWTDNQIFVTPKRQYLDNMRNCSWEPIRNAETCLKDEVKFYPKFLLNFIISLSDFAYDNLNLRKLTPQDELVFCFQRLKSNNIRNHVSACTEQWKPNHVEVLQSEWPNKTDICKTLKHVNSCLENFIKEKCARDIAVDNFLANLTKAIHKPCDDGHNE